jgi:hypothetical protein
MSYRRCADSAFYWDLDKKMIGRSYVDPVDLIWVTATKGGKSCLVSHVAVEQFVPEDIFKNFGRSQATILLRWRLRVMDAKANEGSQWKSRLLDDLDVDQYERDKLLQLIHIFLMEGVADGLDTVKRRTIEVPGTLEAMNDALRYYGVPLCT